LKRFAGRIQKIAVLLSNAIIVPDFLFVFYRVEKYEFISSFYPDFEVEGQFYVGNVRQKLAALKCWKGRENRLLAWRKLVILCC